MSAFAEKIKRHYAGLPLESIEVPEWDIVIHVRPATIGQSAAILAEKDSFRQACKCIQVRSKREDGSPLFDNDDFEAMVSHGEADVVRRICDEIIRIGDVSEADAKKP